MEVFTLLWGKLILQWERNQQVFDTSQVRNAYFQCCYYPLFMLPLFDVK